MLQLLDARYAPNRTVSRIPVQTQLFHMQYTDQNTLEYVDKHTSLFSQLEQMGKDAPIPETHKASILLASTDPKCSLESTAVALRTKKVPERTWDYVTTTLIDEYNPRHSRSTSRTGKGRNRRGRKQKSGFGASKNRIVDNDSFDPED